MERKWWWWWFWRKWRVSESGEEDESLGTSGINHIEKIAKALLGTSMTTNGRETLAKSKLSFQDADFTKPVRVTEVQRK